MRDARLKTETLLYGKKPVSRKSLNKRELDLEESDSLRSRYGSIPQIKRELKYCQRRQAALAALLEKVALMGVTKNENDSCFVKQQLSVFFLGFQLADKSFLDPEEIERLIQLVLWLPNRVRKYNSGGFVRIGLLEEVLDRETELELELTQVIEKLRTANKRQKR